MVSYPSRPSFSYGRNSPRKAYRSRTSCMTVHIRAGLRGERPTLGHEIPSVEAREPGSTDEDHGPGLGYVTIFDTAGHVVRRLAHGLYFNAPWGIAMAPADFGVFSHRLLIGNFGNGNIHAFDPITGKFAGTLLDPTGHAIKIDGLWALSFGGGNPN